MPIHAPSLSTFFRPIFRLVIIASAMAISIVAGAQNSVPPTTEQTAKMPEFASRLAHAVKSPRRPISSARTRAKAHRGPLDSNDLYDNGPIDGFDFGWGINWGYTVADSFQLGQDNSTVNGMSFGAWLFPGDVLETVEISITSSPFGGNVFFDQVVNLSLSDCTYNGGYNICIESASLPNLALNAGTYWVNLQNAVVNHGDPVYWDANSGVGCGGSGCPSQADQNSIGTIPSESFTILGSSTTTSPPTYHDIYACPGPQPGFHELHEFGPDVAPSGLAIDTGGKLYGTFASGGRYGAGLLYDFAQRAGHWFLSSLYSFTGGSNGSSPGAIIVGPDGAIFGPAEGDIQTCGSGNSSCGLIYQAEPCATATCSWNETTIYQFTGNTDAWGGSVSAFDSAGNLYGVSGAGGAYGAGAVFELTPSQGSWTEKILYSFTGGARWRRS